MIELIATGALALIILAGWAAIALAVFTHKEGDRELRRQIKQAERRGDFERVRALREVSKQTKQ